MNTREYLRVKIEDASGTMQDMADFLAHDWLMSAEIDADIEQQAQTATVTLRREVPDPANPSTATVSLAPEITDHLAAGRRITIEQDVTALGVGSPTYTLLFDGRLDDPQWGGDESVVSLPCRDKWGVLHDVWIESVSEYGNDASPVAIETVMQTLLNDTLGSFAPTITVEGNPDFGIVAYDQRQQSLASALNALVDLIGWDLRYRYDASTNSMVLTLREPDPTQITPVQTYDADDYFSLTEVELRTVDIRNVAIVSGTLTSGTIYTATASDSTSIALLNNSDDTGRRAIVLDEEQNGQLNTQAAIDDLAAAVIRDAAQPPLWHVAEQKFSPEIQLGDLIRYSANGVHYDTDQDVAVVGYTHRFTATERTTTVRGRGTQAGSVTRWLRKSRAAERRAEDRANDPPDVPPVGFINPSVNTSTGDGTATASGSSAVNSWRIVGSNAAISDATLEAATPIDGTRLETTDVGTLQSGLEPGDTFYVAAIPYTEASAGGEAGERIDAQTKVGTVSADLVESAQRFGFNGTWSTTDLVASWTAGTFELRNGDSYSITSGSTPNLIADETVTYIYWDPDTSTTAFQTTTSLTTLNASDRNVLVAEAWRYFAGEGVSVVPAVGVLTLDGRSIYPSSVVTDRLAANAVTAAKIFVADLSAISADVGTLTAGTVEGDNVFIDLDATGSSNVLAVGGFSAPGVVSSNSITMRADGTFKANEIRLGGTDFPYFTGSLGVLELSTASKILEIAANRIDAFNATLFTLENTSGPLALKGSTVTVGASGTSLGFYGATPVTKPDVSGSRGGNAALADLLTELANLGLITDSTT